MRLMIDTNILIQIEDPKVLPASLQELLILIRENGHQLFVHKASIEDINQDSDEKRREVILSKLRGYPPLDGPTPDISFLSIVGVTGRPNDRIDNLILYALFRNAADFLITEDKGIASKSKKLNLEDRTLTIEQALVYFKELHKRVTSTHTILKEEPVYRLDVKDAFFDDLKRDYPEFEDWFNKIARKGRKAWVYLDEDKLRALLILKDEDEEVASEPPLARAKRVKISLLKAEPGHKIGELLLKLAFQYCVDNRFGEVYLTHFRTEDDALIYLIEQFGFKLFGKKLQAKTGRYEEVWLKKFLPEDRTLNPIEFSKAYYPLYKDSDGVRKFVVPVVPEYHSRLFPDYKNRQMVLSEYIEMNIPGNAIKKAYLCHAKIKSLKAGDVLLFYRSHDQSKLTSLGIVERATILKDARSIVLEVGKRTVYSYDEIEKMATKSVLVILFRHQFNLPKSLNLATLRSLGILKGQPQSIVEISDLAYKKVKSEAGIDGRFTID